MITLLIIIFVLDIILSIACYIIENNVYTRLGIINVINTTGKDINAGQLVYVDPDNIGMLTTVSPKSCNTCKRNGDNLFSCRNCGEEKRFWEIAK